MDYSISAKPTLLETGFSWPTAQRWSHHPNGTYQAVAEEVGHFIDAGCAPLIELMICNHRNQSCCVEDSQRWIDVKRWRTTKGHTPSTIPLHEL